MARTKQQNRTPTQSVPLLSNNSVESYQRYFLPFILFLTFFIFLPSLQNKFVNLDDTQYVLENAVIKEINIDNLKSIFSEQFVGNYQPLTILSYMADYKFFGLNPFGWHLINLIFHLLNTTLVFLIVQKLVSKYNEKYIYWIPTITSLLFGIHTLHVESVAWVSERKDVLYAFFFLSALHIYVATLIREKTISFLKTAIILFLFLLSLLSKAQAVVLPLVFFLIDFLLQRTLNKRVILEKIPFFLLAIAFGILAINVQGKAGAMQTFQYFPFYERILFSCYALVMYFYKLILPINLSCFYPYPETNDKINTVWVYISPFILIVLAFLTWMYLRKSKIVLFGIGFFMLTIVLVLQLLPVGDALYADRYTYIPSIGLFFIAAHYLVPQFKNKLVVVATLIYLGFLCVFSFNRSRVWYDSITLYNDAIGKGYKAAILYNNRGAAFTDIKDNENAIKDFTSLVELKPRYPNGWKNKGLVHERLEQKEEAIQAFTEAINYFPSDHVNYLRRGTLYLNRNDFENAIKDFSKIIELKPNDGEGYYARSEAYGKSNRLNEALHDINKAIELSPDNGQAYNNRGIIYSMSGKYQEAISDFTRSLQLKPDNISAYGNRSLAYKGMGDYEAALKDILTAKEKGMQVDESLINSLKK